MSSRHVRQMRVPEIGKEGQRLLAAATVVVPGDDLASEVAVRYLAGAGVGTIVVAASRLASIGLAIDGRLAFRVDAALLTIPCELPGLVADGPVARGCAYALQQVAAIVGRR